MYLGLDIGTSGVKAVLVDAAQNIVDQATAPLTVNRPQALWSEQHPQDWWETTKAAVKQLDPFIRDWRRRTVTLLGQNIIGGI